MVAAAASWVAALGAAAVAVKGTAMAVVDVAAVAGGGGEVRSFNFVLEYYPDFILEYYPNIRRKSIIIKNCTLSFLHRTSVLKKKTSLSLHT